MLALYVTLHTFIADRVQAGKDRGATAVEYGLMVALIAVAIITTVGLLGTQLNTMFGAVKDKIVTVVP